MKHVSSDGEVVAYDGHYGNMRLIHNDPRKRLMDVDLVEKLLRCLTERQFQVIQLVHFDHLEPPQVAEILGIKTPSVHTILKNAYRRMAKYAVDNDLA